MMMSKMLLALAVLASCACGTNLPALPSPTVQAAEKSRPSTCTFTLTTVVKGFNGSTVAAVVPDQTAGCEAPLVEWKLLTNPDGVTYNLYETREDLLLDQPTTSGSRFLRLTAFIAANPICLEATDGTTTRRVGMIYTTTAYCEGL